jgi:hypothetical protein
MGKEIEPCKVCQTKTTDSCSHVKCPNRKLITAQVGDGSQTVHSKDALGRGYADGYRKFPTKSES